MQTVEIHALRTMKEGMSIFSVLVAGPGSGISGEILNFEYWSKFFFQIRSHLSICGITEKRKRIKGRWTSSSVFNKCSQAGISLSRRYDVGT